MGMHKVHVDLLKDTLHSPNQKEPNTCEKQVLLREVANFKDDRSSLAGILRRDIVDLYASI